MALCGPEACTRLNKSFAPSTSLPLLESVCWVSLHQSPPPQGTEHPPQGNPDHGAAKDSLSGQASARGPEGRQVTPGRTPRRAGPPLERTLRRRPSPPPGSLPPDHSARSPAHVRRGQSLQGPDVPASIFLCGANALICFSPLLHVSHFLFAGAEPGGSLALLQFDNNFAPVAPPNLPAAWVAGAAALETRGRS